VAGAAAIPFHHAGPSTLLRRALTAVVAVPVLVWVVAGAPAVLFHGVLVVASAVASWELARMFAGAGRGSYPGLAVVAGAALTASFATPINAALPTYPMVVLVVAVLVILSAPVWIGGGPNAEAVANTVLGLVYIAWLLGYGVLLHRIVGGPGLVLFLMGVTWAGETAAYLVGSSVGRHPLAPVLSPRKTVEGGLAQLVASALAALALAAWLLPGCGMPHVLGAGVLIGLVGQLGDLAESALKRSVGVKDAGGILPGHGGVLDRLDSLLFNLPVFFYYWTYVGCGT
jgi:phosphatidate cytidylyltransferase